MILLSESPLVSVTKAEKHIEVIFHKLWYINYYKPLPHLSVFCLSASQDQIHLFMLLLKTSEQKSCTRLANKPKATLYSNGRTLFKWQNNVQMAEHIYSNGRTLLEPCWPLSLPISLCAVSANSRNSTLYYTFAIF